MSNRQITPEIDKAFIKVWRQFKKDMDIAPNIQAFIMDVSAPIETLIKLFENEILISAINKYLGEKPQ